VKVTFEVPTTVGAYLCAQLLFHREQGIEIKNALELFHRVLLPGLGVEGKPPRLAKHGFIEDLLTLSSHPLTDMFLKALRDGGPYGFAAFGQSKVPPPEQI
jgi:hypothetical protein